MNSTHSIWTIVPCFNEGKRLPVEEFNRFLYHGHEHLHFLFVNDGSTDDTKEVLDGISNIFPEKAKVLHLEKNVGKAEAVRFGMLHVLEQNISCDYVGFMDADLATPLDELEKIITAISDYSSPSMIIGSRIKLFGSTQITRTDSRHYVGRVIGTFISRSLKLPIYDTQCGFKFVRHDRVSDLFSANFISRWLFDVEIIFRLLNLTGYTKIYNELIEMPVTKWDEKGDSRIPLTYVFRIPFELLRIKRRYNKATSNSN